MDDVINFLKQIPLWVWVLALALLFAAGLVCFLLVASKVKRAYEILLGRNPLQEIGPQPFMVQKVEPVHYATKDDLKRVEDTGNATARDLGKLRIEILQNGDKRKTAIEGRVDAVRDDLSKQIKELSEQVANMPSQVIATLRNAKEIIKS